MIVNYGRFPLLGKLPSMLLSKYIRQGQAAHYIKHYTNQIHIVYILLYTVEKYLIWELLEQLLQAEHQLITRNPLRRQATLRFHPSPSCVFVSTCAIPETSVRLKTELSTSHLSRFRASGFLDLTLRDTWVTQLEKPNGLFSTHPLTQGTRSVKSERTPLTHKRQFVRENLELQHTPFFHSIEWKKR